MVRHGPAKPRNRVRFPASPQLFIGLNRYLVRLWYELIIATFAFFIRVNNAFFIDIPKSNLLSPQAILLDHPEVGLFDTNFFVYEPNYRGVCL